MAEASAKRVTGDEPQGTMGRVQTPVVSFPPSFARIFSSNERRLGTRQRLERTEQTTKTTNDVIQSLWRGGHWLVKSPRMIFHVMTFSRLCLLPNEFPPAKNTLWSANFVRLNIFSKEKKKDLLILSLIPLFWMRISCTCALIKVMFLFPIPLRGERYRGVNLPPP